MENLIFKSNEKVLFIGDSITDCGRRQDEEKLGHGYVRKITELLTAKYSSHHIDYVNKGIGGDIVEGLENRWSEDVISERPDWLSIKIGINNAARQTEPNEEYLPKWENSYRQILTRSFQELELNGIFMFEIFYIAEDVQEPRTLAILEYNEIIHRLAEDFNAYLVQVSTSFKQAVTNRPNALWTTRDGVHPNAAGHTLMALEFLKQAGW
ncbi:MAG: SGNH/GDSL hydrolase family protein [Candidatus Poribacteria bacterium]|nr:SGNH/GDSL hydrolase family protein [Candidatus Poribacteria bacterium]